MARRATSKRKRAPRVGRSAKRSPPASRSYGWSRLVAYLGPIFRQTILVRVIIAFVVLWFVFAGALYFTDRNAPGSTIHSYGDALYWSVAAFSTAGIADTPKTGLSQFVGATWIVVGSVIFFGTIVATITSYFMRPIERPVSQIIETIEYNLNRLDELSVDELALLKKTSDALILHMERLKEREQQKKRSRR